MSADQVRGDAGHDRLRGVDSLRGVAAMAVVLFHFTRRFQELHNGYPLASFNVPWGHYGVNLFFVISGFVIFMTLDRTRRPMDFVVSRFSRLFPSYWTAIIITFAVTHALGHFKAVPWTTALANIPMVHGFFGVAHVDGVYWTLEVELYFYAWMLLLFHLKQLDRVFLFVALFLALRWVYFGAHAIWGVDLPFRLWRLTILAYLPWFALGLCAYALHRDTGAGRARKHAWALAAFALVTLGATEPAQSWGLMLLALACFGLVLLAAMGRIPWLELKPLVWLGGISYPLYLLHENIGWAFLERLSRLGLPMDAAIALVLVAVLLISHVVSRSIEQPVMHRIRAFYKARRAAVVQA